ncbi:putative OB-fold protein [Variovorax boronicumulans]|uniref:Zn-ribbon domain-containing OB-fold protein n=1 Tax=Variovorax boronicumulans TaxID=436515 RepID=UPI002781D5B7|nr:OB-fold domain-containing protein [Variovorax boronicumulans]MDP9908680.1 putative OB-fold protein [Variovorax boronicumulans]
MEITKYPEPHFRNDADGMTLLGARYRDTGELRFPPPEFLQAGEAAEPVSMGASGRLYTFTTVHPAKAAAYALGMVDFDIGLRVFGRLAWPEGSEPAIGDVVHAVAFALPDGTPDYAFAPLKGAAA